jgi:hypothetical protein
MAYLTVSALVDEKSQIQGIADPGSHNRFPSFMYTEEGKKVADRLWTETLDAFEFVNIRQRLEAM